MDVLNKYGEAESTYMNYCGFKYIIAIPCKNDKGEIIVSDVLYENSYQITNGDGRAWAEKEIKKYQYTYDEIVKVAQDN
ncbi:MAG: hypothetical protein J6K58_02095 [Lachnospiraceae bacterium]|nr:hypothetical protein [Lachnospiraceae bacterium]